MNARLCVHGATIFEARHVSLALDGVPVLRDVSLRVRDIRRPAAVTGQVVALLGPSGVGKTRLFRLLAGLDEPDSGCVLVGERAVPVRRGMVGVVAQRYPLFAHRTVLGNLLLAGRLAGLSPAAARAKACALLSRFSLLDRASHYPAQLSGGQQQRVAIAQQFLCSEHFLLLDEPFSGLDPIAVREVCALVNEMASLDELNTIIVVTHDIAAALEVADTVWLLGRDRAPDGSPVPGARIQAEYDLTERGLAWRGDKTQAPGFHELLCEIRDRFPSL